MNNEKLQLVLLALGQLVEGGKSEPQSSTDDRGLRFDVFTRQDFALLDQKARLVLTERTAAYTIYLHGLSIQLDVDRRPHEK